VRKLVEMHGGAVYASSKGLGKGSQFVMRLTTVVQGQSVNHNKELVQPVVATQSRRRVLIVDDNRDLADSLTLILRRYGHTVRAVYDGESALDTVDAFGPDVVFLDIGLPGMDGFEVAQQLGLHHLRKTLRLVALTGYGQEEDTQRIAMAGFDRHLVKPVKTKELQEVLAV
jgi:CheY-like chemotaxis protein